MPLSADLSPKKLLSLHVCGVSQGWVIIYILWRADTGQDLGTLEVLVLIQNDLWCVIKPES